jgi:hypothetical protein
MKAIFFSTVVFFSALMFSVGIIYGTMSHILLSFIYTILISIVASSLLWMNLKNYLFISPYFIAFLGLCNHGGILIGFLIASGPDDLLWPVDAMNHHLQNAINFSSWLTNGGSIEFFDENPFKKIYISNMWVGTFFSLLGVYPASSGIAMVVIKLVTIILIYKSALIITQNQWMSSSAAIIYALIPTVTFYTIQFYKDFFIQFIVALIIYIIFKFKTKFLAIVFMIFPLAFLIIDRFYLAIIFLISYSLYYFIEQKNIIKNIVATSFGILISLIIYYYYFNSRSLADIFQIIADFTDSHNNSLDSTPTTNIAFDLLRITFTPFFNGYKLDNYFGFDSLLIFGGFIHQVLMLFYFKGLWMYRKNKLAIINTSVLFLLIILGLIMPFDGRARDSLYPLISIFAAIGISAFIAKGNN